MQLLAQVYNDNKIQSLVCFCCAQIYTNWMSTEVVTGNFFAVKSPICMVQGKYLIESLIGSGENRKNNFEDAVFRERYMANSASLQADSMLAEGCWEWRRILRYANNVEVPVLCCPSDVISCQTGLHERHVMCGECIAPLCKKCGSRLLLAQSIPMAIANHNFIGYCLDTIVRYRVRWIEAAAVCPAFTTMICFYLEEDRGHLMNEQVFGPQHRVGVRGNVFSFPMPWDAIMNSLLQAVDSRNLTLPHPPQMLAHMVRLHLKAGHSVVTRHLKEICVRTHVLLRLGYDLIEAGHAALVKRSNAGPISRAGVVRIKKAYEEMVEKLYPTPTDPEDAIFGVPPKEVLEVYDESVTARQRQSPLHEKNATPPAGAMCTDTVFDTVQPQMVVPERHADAGTTTAEIGHAALSRFNDLQVQTGNKFMPQFRPQYLQEVMPFDFKHVTGGPEFSKEDRLRHDDAPFVDLFDYTSGLPRRIERHMRSSWVVVPALRNLCFRYNVLNATSIAYKHDVSEANSLEDHGKELCAAASELYHHLENGYSRTPTGQRCPIKGDISKLRYAEKLSDKAKQLEKNLRYVSSQQCGVQEVRHKIGNALLGARISYGEPLFITVSPSSRHSGLVLRLSRVRPKDISSLLCLICWSNPKRFKIKVKVSSGPTRLMGSMGTGSSRIVKARLDCQTPWALGLLDSRFHGPLRALGPWGIGRLGPFTQ